MLELQTALAMAPTTSDTPAALDSWELEACSLLLLPEFEASGLDFDSFSKPNAKRMDTSSSLLPASVRSTSPLMLIGVSACKGRLEARHILGHASGYKDLVSLSRSDKLTCRNITKAGSRPAIQPLQQPGLAAAQLQEVRLLRKLQTVVTACRQAGQGSIQQGFHLARPSRLECLQQLLSQIQPPAAICPLSAVHSASPHSRLSSSRQNQRETGDMATKLPTVSVSARSRGYQHPMQLLA